jgi:spermidine synthase
MGFELSIVLLFQVIYGYVYLGMCMLVTLFMIGSALGAQAAKKTCKRPDRDLIVTDLAFILFALVGWAVSWAGVGWKSVSLLLAMQFALIPALVFACALIVGYQFTVASVLMFGSTSEVIGRLYLSDLAGAACGTILTGLVLIPKIGIVGALLAVAAVKTVSLGLNVMKKCGP